MTGQEGITFVAAVNDDEVLQKNLLGSSVVSSGGINQVIIKRGFNAASLAYNEAIDESENDIIVFIHQDVFLLENWIRDLKQSLSYLEKEKINWGVLGCFGARIGEADGLGLVYTTGLGVHGRAIEKPEPVETLDEIVLVLRKSSGLRFDPTLPHFHMYGADICMTAREKGMPAYVIPAFCIHNTNQIITLPREFYECYRHIKRQWRKYLPIHTPCISITLFDSEIHERRLRGIYRTLFRKPIPPVRRAADPKAILEHL